MQVISSALLPLLFTLGASAPSPPQDVAGPSPMPLPTGWVPLDGVAIVVNADTITRRAIERFIVKAMAEKKITTQDQINALAQEAQRTQVESLLMRQAGENLGFSKEMIDAHVSGKLEEQKDDAGGTFERAQQLREQETTAVEIREDLEQETLMMEWQRKIAGFGAPGARTTEDRYQRPGKLAQHYRRMQRTGRDIEALGRLGATPAQYELQVLLLHEQVYGLEEAKNKALLAKQALDRGDADWDDLVGTIGNYENQGLTGARRLEELQFGLDPGDNRLVQFVMEGQTDRISEVMPFPDVNPATGQRRVGGFALYKLISTQPAKLPAYRGPGVQKELRRVIGRVGDDLRIQLALEDLERTAYIWYPGIEDREAQIKAQLDKRDEAIEEARRKNAEKLEQGESETESETNGSPEPDNSTGPAAEPSESVPPAEGTDEP